MAFSRLIQKLCRSILIALFVSSLWLSQSQSAVVSNLNTCKPCLEAPRDPATLTLVAHNDLIKKKSCCALNVKREFDDSQTAEHFLLADGSEVCSIDSNAKQTVEQKQFSQTSLTSRQEVNMGVVATLKNLIHFAKAFYREESQFHKTIICSLFFSFYCKPFKA